MGHAILLGLGLLAGCRPHPGSTDAEPAPRAAMTELSGKVSVTGSEPITLVVLTPAEGRSVALVGSLEGELRRLAGATVTVEGAQRDQASGRGFEVRGYEVVELDGARPAVGVLEARNGTLWLVGRESVELAAAPEELQGAPGSKVWIVGRRVDGRLAVQSYGIIRPAGE